MYAPVFILFCTDHLPVVRLEQIGNIQMQVGTDILPFFHVAVHRQNFQGKDILHQRLYLTQPGFLLRLFQRHAQKIRISVRVPAQPAPGIVNIMVGHQHFRPVRRADPGARRHMTEGILPAEYILFPSKRPENQFFVPLLHLIERLVFFNFFYQPKLSFFCHPFSCSSCRLPKRACHLSDVFKRTISYR